MTGAGDGEGPIETYLDRLVVEMAASPPRRFRRLLAEAEEHLRDDRRHLVAEGLSEDEAERQAVGRFGAARDLAADDRRQLMTPLHAVARRVLVSGLLLAGVGGIAVGLSGLIAGLFRAVAGSSFLVDVAPHQTLSAADCARWLALQPGAASCRDAAVADWANETVAYRIAAGILGVTCLLGYAWVRHRSSPGNREQGLPRAVSDAIGVTAFAGGAAWTLVMGLQMVTTAHGQGSGQWLSAAPVALVGVVVFGLRLLSDLRDSQPGTP